MPQETHKKEAEALNKKAQLKSAGVETQLIQSCIYVLKLTTVVKKTLYKTSSQ